MFFILGLFESTALYGIISLLFCVFSLKIGISTIYQEAINTSTFIGYFYAFMFWSTITYIILMLIHIFIVKIGDRFFGGYTTSRSIGSLFFSFLGADLTNPFRGLIALKGASRVIDSTGFYRLYDWGTVVLHFIWALAFIGFIAIGFINLL